MRMPQEEKKTQDIEQLRRSPVTFSRVIALFKPHALALCVVVVLIVITSALTVVQPFIVRRIVDEAIAYHNVRLLVGLVVAMIGLTILTQGIGVIQTWMSSHVGQKIMHTLRVKAFESVQQQSMSFFTKTHGGEIQSRLTNDIAGMRNVVTATATSIASNLTTAIATIIAMIALSPRLSALSLLVLPPALMLTCQVALTRRRITEEHQRAQARMQQNLSETLSVSGIRLAKNLGAQHRLAEDFAENSAALISLELESQMAGRWRMATMQIIFAIIPALVYLAAGLPVTSAGMTIGTLIAFSALQSQVFRPLMGLLNIGAQWVSSMALFSRIFEYLDMDPEIKEAEDLHDDWITDNSITMHNVSFHYADAQDDALSHVSFVVEEGTTTAIVGHTGSGKSTIAALLTRIADPSSGVVRLGGVDLRSISDAQRTKRIGVVSQETYLMHASIADNLRLAKPQASELEMWEALEKAKIADLVMGLPEQLQTIVGSRGYRFSGGEQQRLTLARTLLADPKILILDEATSALDTATERAVNDVLSDSKTTRIVIAHRLSTIREADQILVMEAGRIVERGTHEELLALAGRYKDLVFAASREAVS